LISLLWFCFSILKEPCFLPASTEEGCCPTCPPGMYVSRHCTEFTSTSCASCTEGTFQDGDNGREQCFSCKHCDAGLGLKAKKSCSSTSDAVCEVLDEFFCSDSNRGGCRAAQRHTVCSPGQYIGQRGTADKDTECPHCTDGTFSDGTSSSCQNHTKCESVGLKLMRPGTDSTDSECGEHGPHAGLVAGIVIPGVILTSRGRLFATSPGPLGNHTKGRHGDVPGTSRGRLFATSPGPLGNPTKRRCGDVPLRRPYNFRGRSGDVLGTSFC
uniref:TNFR-Cys domain-containing protein n=1 Tax=Gadus morhua TaxID=8049 RepID=A0A8C4Z8T2_GADMO